jgi:hypothetical protein
VNDQRRAVGDKPNLSFAPSLAKEDSSRFLGIDYFISPLPLVAVAILIFNDRYLKVAVPSWVTGKLSDLSGIFFFPLFALALGDLARSLWRRGMGSVSRCSSPCAPPRLALLVLVTLSTDVLFVGIKLSPAFHDIYVTALAALIQKPVQVVMDATDLGVLPLANGLTWLHYRRWLKRARAGHP